MLTNKKVIDTWITEVILILLFKIKHKLLLIVVRFKSKCICWIVLRVLTIYLPTLIFIFYYWHGKRNHIKFNIIYLTGKTHSIIIRGKM